MRVGVTGGAGYIGSHVVRDLLEKHHEVLVLDNLSSGSRQNVYDREAGYQFLEGDLHDPGSLDDFFAFQPEAVFHFAGLKAAGESMTHPGLYSAANLRGTLTLLERQARSNCRAFIFSSSAAVYGNPQRLPIDEAHPTVPANYYGHTKLALEENLAWFSKLAGIRFAALRYFNAAGYDARGRVQGLERNPNNLLPIVMEVAIGTRAQIEVFGTDYDTPDGSCIRDYIHVNDLARAHLLAMDYILADRDLTVNLGTGRGVSVREVIEMARQVTGHDIPHVDSPRRAGDPAELWASAERARIELGWEAESSDLETLLATTWRAYQRDRGA